MSLPMEAQMARRVIEQNDALISWLAKIAELLQGAGAQQSSGYIEQAGRLQSLLELLVAQAIPSSPQVTRELTINAVTPQQLFYNESVAFQRIVVTNDDPAQMMWIGKQNVTPISGEILLAQTQRAYVLPQGDDLWGICAIAALSCRVSQGFDLLGMTQVQRQ